MKHLARLLSLLALLGLLAIPAQAQPSRTTITVVDDHHTAITLQGVPQRLISLAPSVTEVLFALGLGPRVVAVSSFSNYPPAAAKLPTVIDYNGADTEKILALKPDLLIAASINSPPIIAKLRSLHLPVLVTDPQDIPGILHDITIVGEAAGVPQTAKQLVGSLQRRIDAVVAHAHATKIRPRVYYEIDTTYYTAGRGSFVNSLISLAGGNNIAGKIHSPYPRLSQETIIASDPQVIVLGDTAFGASVSTVSHRPGWSTISAVRLHHVYAFNDDLASRPGPRIVQGLEQLARLLHPEWFGGSPR